jgi:EAL domain-containing protein (putative c-di-GMP-specific phosphodiesterase class I)
MSLRFRSAKPDEARMLLLARDPRLVSATRAAARGLERLPPRLMRDGGEVLALLFCSNKPPQQVICQPSVAGASWPALLATASDPFGSTDMVLVVEGHAPEQLPDGISPASLTWATAEPLELARALRQAAANRRQVPTDNPEHLAAGLRRGEIAVRYQPAVRISDRRPVLLEGLARWQRQDDTPLSPDAFVPMAERHGLGRALSVAVADRAFSEMASNAARVGATLSLNLPLNVLVERDVLRWLRTLQARRHFPAGALTLEMTETAPVLDRTALRRALLRLRDAGLPVLVDDMGLDEDRGWLLSLPFAGIKLDRHLVGAMPASARARGEVRRLVRMAHAAGMSVTAEGVSDARLWRSVAAAGVDNAQGYAIGRPLPAVALPAWRRAWMAQAVSR